MRARLLSRGFICCLVIGLGVTLSVTSALGQVHQRDPLYSGMWQDFGGGWQYIYFTSQDQAYWRQVSSNSRLSYQYTPGQWLDCDKFGTWRNIGGSGVTDWWIGDGVWHNLKNGWSYAYSVSLSAGYWGDASGQRLAYFYTPGQWWEIGAIGGWSILSGTGLTGAFVGDGVWHNLGNGGWYYAYFASMDTGYWYWSGIYSSGQRLAYNYTPGRWWDMGKTGMWSMLSSTGVSPVFIGDGVWHSLNNGWTYAYSSSLDTGYWGISANQRFAYQYTPGKWWDIGANGGWDVLSGTGMSSDFVGDGNWHDLKSNNYSWFYAYLSSLDTGYWGLESKQRFAYDYSRGLWYYIGDSGGWYNLVSTALSSDFLGDRQWHDLKNGWAFSFAHTNLWDLDLFSRDSGQSYQFEWQTTDLNWYRCDIGYGGQMDGFGNLGTSWMWDGLIHQAGSSWMFRYDYGLNELAFYALSNGSNISFLKYSWSDHEWYDRLASPSATWCHISTGGSTTPEVVRTYWGGYIYDTGAAGSGEHISINASYAAPSETITKNASPGTSWVYTYLDGQWLRYPGSTQLAIGADPDLYR